MSETTKSSSRAKLSPAKQALLKQRLKGKRSKAKEPAQTIPLRAGSEPAPLSFAQQRLWFLTQLEPEHSGYHLPLAFHIQGPLDGAALERSLGEIVRRHEVLRTVYPTDNGEPVQTVTSHSFTLPRVDLQHLPPAAAEAEAQRLFTKAMQRHFDLSQGPMLRTQLLRLSPEKHVLLLSIHHIAFDEWSYDIFCRELSTLYESVVAQQPVVLPDLPIQYSDFAAWQRSHLSGAILKKQLAYWTQQLDGAPHAIDLPFDRPRPAIQTANGARHQVHLSKPLTEALKLLSRQAGTTLFMTLLAAFKVLLYRYSNQTDLVVGTPITNRNRAETEPLIGLFLNMIALRSDLSGAPSFRELLAQVREVALAGYSHQDLPFEQLVEELQLDRDLSRAPLVQVMFILQNSNLSALHLPGLTIERSQFGSRSALYDLTLFLNERAEGLVGAFDYSPDLFEAETVARLAGHLQNLLEATIADPDQSIAALSMLGEAEQQQQLHEWNDTSVAYPLEQSLMARLANQAENRPHAPAFILPDGETLEYRTLNRQANRLAHYLRSLDVQPGTRIALCLERSFEAVIGLMGIFKAGGVYVPLDPAYPQERLAFMLEDAQVAAVLTQERLRYILPETQAKIIDLDADQTEIERQPATEVTAAVTPESLAYIIYTSGSTGRPKGVAVAHRQILNRLLWMWETYPFAPDEVSCQKTALSFVDSLWELFGPLLQGSPTLIIPDQVLQEPTRFVDTLRAHGVTRLWLVPSLLRAMLDTLPDLRKQLPRLNFWVTTGEPLAVELLHRFQKQMPGAILYNLYGTSEAWDVTWYEPEAPAQAATNVAIGRPIANMYTYILNQALQPVPPGVAGELYVAGVGLAEGYLDRPELTAEIFRANPFPRPKQSGENAARFYKTGDLARYRPDGQIEFIGRVDHQVKLRGFRVEPGEIETALNHHPALRQSVVLAREDTPGDKRLVAYIVPKHKTLPTPSELNDFLGQTLPTYMIPAVYVPLEALPLTPSGKINRLALPKPDQHHRETRAKVVAPRDTLELQLVKIWEKLLRTQPIGIHENFFALGGHSLLAIQLFTQIRNVIGVELPLATLFQAPTIEQLAEVIRAGTVIPDRSLIAIQVGGSKPPFFCIPGNLGNVFTDLGYLARHFDPDHPFYAFQDGVQNPAQIKQLAARYIDEIKAIQPTGPYFLGGICSGGMVAFEMAHQLQQQGEPVPFVGIVEPPHPNQASGPQAYLNFVLAVGRRFLLRAGDQGRQMIHHQASAGEQGSYVQLKKKLLANLWAIFRYTPAVYQGRIDLFLTEESLKIINNPQLEWSNFAQNQAYIHQIPGNHNTITGNNDTEIEESHMRGLAKALANCINKIGT